MTLKLGLLISFLAVLATPVLADGVQLGFDQSSYLVAPDKSQQIYVQLEDGAGILVKAATTTYVWISPNSPTAQISTKVSSPYNFEATSSAKLTIAKGNSRRSFVYKDSTLGDFLISATGSGLLSGSVKVTIGYPPPPPPPAVIVEPVVTVATPINIPVSAQEVVSPVPEQVVNIEVPTSTTVSSISEQPAVLSDQITPVPSSAVPSISPWDELIAWLKELFFATISP